MPSARAKKKSVLYISAFAAAAAVGEHHGTFTPPPSLQVKFRVTLSWEGICSEQ